MIFAPEAEMSMGFPNKSKLMGDLVLTEKNTPFALPLTQSLLASLFKVQACSEPIQSEFTTKTKRYHQIRY